MNDDELITHELTLNDGRVLTKQRGAGIRAPHANEQVSVRFNYNSARIKAS